MEFTMAKKKPQHGGARTGAGRPVSPDGPAVVMAVSVPQSLAQELAEYAESQGLKRSAVVVEALKGFLARKKR